PAIQGYPVTHANAECVGEGPLEHHTTWSNPAARCQRGMVNRGWNLAGAYYLRRAREVADSQHGARYQIRPAVLGYAWGPRQRLGLRRDLFGPVRRRSGFWSAERRKRGTTAELSDHIRAVGYRPGPLVRVVGHPAEGQPHRQRRRRGGNR